MRGFIFVVAFCCSLYSCIGWDSGKCSGDYSFYQNNDFYFDILDKSTKKNVLDRSLTKYNYDTFMVFREDWTKAFDPPVALGGVMPLRFTDEPHDLGLVDSIISRRFYVYFNYQDIDTIDISFRSNYGQCHYQVIDYFKVAYNKDVYFDGATPKNKVPLIDFLKAR